MTDLYPLKTMHLKWRPNISLIMLVVFSLSIVLGVSLKKEYFYGLHHSELLNEYGGQFDLISINPKNQCQQLLPKIKISSFQADLFGKNEGFEQNVFSNFLFAQSFGFNFPFKKSKIGRFYYFHGFW